MNIGLRIRLIIDASIVLIDYKETHKAFHFCYLQTDGELHDYNVKDNLDPNAHPAPAEMLHYLGGPRSEDGSYVHADLTK